jgi:hypothetical protein
MELADCWLLIAVAGGSILEFGYERKKLLVIFF